MNAPITTIGLDAQPRLVAHYRLHWEEVQKAWVLLYPEGMVKLNGSAGEIMKRCDGERSVEAIAIDIETAHTLTGLQADVLAFVALAAKQQWLTWE